MMTYGKSPLFGLYKQYSEYKFSFRRSHENFKVFIEQYEQMRQKVDDEIFSKCSRLQIKILDLLTVSNLASDEDVESIIDTLENLRAVDNIYEKVKENIESLTEASVNSNKVETAELEFDIKPSIWEEEITPSPLINDDYNEVPQKMEKGNYTVIKFTNKNHTNDEAKPKPKAKQKGSKRKRIQNSEDEETDRSDDDDYVLPPHQRKILEDMDEYSDANEDDNEGDDEDSKSKIEPKPKRKIGRPRIHPKYEPKKKSFIREYVMRSSDKSQFSCKACGSIFKDRKSCVSHAKNVHVESKLVSRHRKPMFYKKTDDGKCICDGCGMHFDRSVSLRRHKTANKCGNLDNLEYVCSTCKDDEGKPLEFKTWKDYRKHRSEVHDVGKKYGYRDRLKELVQCDECDKMVSRAHLPVHKKTVHMGIKKQCPYCGKMRSEKGIYGHIRWHIARMKGDVLLCEQCDYKTNLASNLTAHIKTKHLLIEENTFTCDTCGKGYTSKKNLEVHKKCVHSEKVQCPHCFKMYSRYTLEEHIKLIHNDGKKMCAFCSFETTDKDTLREHVNRQHPYEAGVQPKSKPSRLYVCEFNCGFTTDKKYAIHVHRKKEHTGIPIKCDQCDYSSVFPAKVKYHKEVRHLGIKYPCKYCDYQTTTKTAVRNHMLKHHPEFKLYSCHLCKFRTEHKHLLLKHLEGGKNNKH